VCPDTGRPHLQGYLECTNQRTLDGFLKSLFQQEKALGHSVRLTPARGTADENKTYCSKSDPDPELWGVFTKSRKGQGKRNDWETMLELAQQDAPVQSFYEEAPHLAMPHHSKIQAWKSVFNAQKTRTWKTIPKIFLGPPRVGKSTSMRKQASELAEKNNWRIYTKSDADKWWPGYDGEEIILIDEAHGGFWQWQELLRFFEEGQYTVQYKGGSIDFLGRVVFMTTNSHPALWYKKHPLWDDSNAFRARIEEFGELWTFRERGPLEKSMKVYPEPTRDLKLLAPAPAAAPPVVTGQAAGYVSPWGLERGF